jgi:hypothetical protein
MTTRRLIFASILITSLPMGSPRAETCAEGKIEQCFVDGDTVECLCLPAPAEVVLNPAPEPDGQINEDGGG